MTPEASLEKRFGWKKLSIFSVGGTTGMFGK
jgi:hypothetical protein